MLIKAKLTPFSLPLIRPLQTGRGTFSSRDGVLVEIEASDHLKGYGEATPIQGFKTESFQQAWDVLGRFLPAFLRQKKWTVEQVLKDFRFCFPFASAALCAIDTALCDLSAKQQGLSVAALLAGEFNTRASSSVRVNALLQEQDVKKIVREASDRYREGFRTFKIKVGALSIEQDIKRVAAVRGKLGQDVKIRLDANQAWTLEQADEALRALSPLSIEYLEQPLSSVDLQGAAALRKRHTLLLAADEGACSAEDILAVLKKHAADIIVLKPAAAGGPHQSMHMAINAAQVNVPCITTTLMDGAVGRAMATHVAAALPGNRVSYACGLATGALLDDDLCAGLEVADGYITIDRVKGLGVEVDSDRLAKVATGRTMEFLA